MLQRRSDSLADSMDRFWADFAPYLEHPFPGPDPAAIGEGDIPIGQALGQFGETAGPAALPMDAFPTHVFVGGAPKTGKTYFIVYLISSLVVRGVPCWVFDRMGDITRYLLWLFGPDVVNVFDLETFKRNPLEASDWRKAMFRLRRPMREEYMRDGQLNLGSQTVKKLYEGYGPKPPTFADVYDDLEQKTFSAVSRRQAYKESLQNRLGAWKDFVPAYNCRRGYPIEQLLRQTCVFDVKGISPDLMGFFIKEILLAAEEVLLDQGGDDPVLGIAIDEAHLLDSREMMNRNDVGEPVIRSLTRTMRHCSATLILGDQTPSLVPNQLLAMTATKINFRVTNGACATTLASSMALTKEQAEFFPRLQDRQAVCYSASFKGQGAFMLQVPTLNFEKTNLEDVAEAKRLSAKRFEWTPIEETPVQVVQDKARSKAPHVERNNAKAKEEPPTDRASESVLSRLSKRAADYLELIRRTPGQTTSERDRANEIPIASGSTMRKELGELDLIAETEVRVVNKGGSGGKGKAVSLTEAGERLLALLKRDAPNARGRGSPEHVFWQHRLANQIKERSPEAETEIEGGETKTIDVLVRLNSRRYAIEVSITSRPDGERENVVRDLVEADEVYVLADGMEHLESIRALIDNELGNADKQRVRYGLLYEFMGQLFPQ